MPLGRPGEAHLLCLRRQKAAPQAPGGRVEWGCGDSPSSSCAVLAEPPRPPRKSRFGGHPPLLPGPLGSQVISTLHAGLAWTPSAPSLSSCDFGLGFLAAGPLCGERGERALRVPGPGGRKLAREAAHASSSLMTACRSHSVSACQAAAPFPAVYPQALRSWSPLNDIGRLGPSLSQEDGGTHCLPSAGLEPELSPNVDAVPNN